MLHKIDWVSFTRWIFDQDEQVPPHLLRPQLFVELPAWTGITEENHRPAGKRPGFQFGVSNNDHTISVWISLRGLLLFEITGGGCTALEKSGQLDAIVKENATRLTRLDLATDILTDTDPRDFVKMRGDSKVTAVGEFASKTGVTCYVGSKKSDRTVKVYRYHDPHPRSQFLRIEYTYRSKQATFAALHMIEHGIEQTIFSSANRYGWTHPCWQPEKTTAEELKAWRPERGEAKTVNWLRTQVLAAVKKLNDQGVMSVTEYCDFLLSQCSA